MRKRKEIQVKCFYSFLFKAHFICEIAPGSEMPVRFYFLYTGKMTLNCSLTAKLCDDKKF